MERLCQILGEVSSVNYEIGESILQIGIETYIFMLATSEDIFHLPILHSRGTERHVMYELIRNLEVKMCMNMEHGM